jgi:hypothetical protein
MINDEKNLFLFFDFVGRRELVKFFSRFGFSPSAFDGTGVIGGYIQLLRV